MAPIFGSGDDRPPARFAWSWAARLSGRDEQSLNGYLEMLMAVSLGIGLLSTLATSFAIYWFVKMRRSFRHDLIMLLIQSDLIKALWFVIFPIVTYTVGPVESDSTFCQVSGFFFAVGIESSDVAVLLIALHSALYIYRPKSGLYPYRWLAYAAYVLVPLLFASLAFLDGGYQNVGYYCYLSNEHGWARLALGWVPRYILFAIIFVIYVCIYAYVRGRILHYKRRDSAEPQKPAAQCATQAACRDRIRSLPTPFRPAVGRPQEKKRSVSFNNTFSARWAEDTPVTRPVFWNLPRFADVSSSSVHESLSEKQERHNTPLSYPEPPSPTACPPWRSGTSKDDGFPLPSTITESWQPTMATESVTAEPSQTVNFMAPVHRPSSCTTIPAMFPVCRKAMAGPPPPPPPHASTNGTRRDSAPEYLDGAGAAASTLSPPRISHDPLTSHVSRNRDKVRRQLRSLFVYPLLYLVMWIFPLVNQAYGYADDSGRPPWILVLSLASLAVQGAANSAVFTAREKPWRYTGGEGFWASIRDGWWGSRTDGVGRTREEMLVEVRIARARREAEMMDEVGGKEKRQAGPRRHWWDVKEYDVAADGGV